MSEASAVAIGVLRSAIVPLVGLRGILESWAAGPERFYGDGPRRWQDSMSLRSESGMNAAARGGGSDRDRPIMAAAGPRPPDRRRPRGTGRRGRRGGRTRRAGRPARA